MYAGRRIPIVTANAHTTALKVNTMARMTRTAALPLLLAFALVRFLFPDVPSEDVLLPHEPTTEGTPT